MTKVTIMLICLICSASLGMAQEIEASFLLDKYWVEQVPDPATNLLVFEAQSTKPKNAIPPFNPSVFHFIGKNKIEVTDARWCNEVIPLGTLKGEYKVKRNEFSFQIEECITIFKIHQLSKDILIIEPLISKK